MSKRHILLLDPNGGNRRNLAFLLHLAGYQVTEAVNGDETINRVALCPELAKIDLLLVCLGEPGIDLGGILRQTHPLRLRVLIVSEEVGLIRHPAAPTTLPQICQRGEVIDTLARLWPSDPTSLFHPAPIGHLLQEH